MSRRIAHGVSIVAITIASLGACDRAGSPEPLRVGLLVSTTGPSAERGLVQRNAAALAASEINARGGVLGRPIQLVHGEDGSDPARVPGVVEGILRTIDVPLVLGPVASEVVELASDTIGPRAVVLTASTTTGVGGAASPHCLCAPDVDQGEALAELVFARGVRTVAILCPETTTGRVLSDAFHARFLALGGAVPFYSRYRPDRSEFLSVVRPAGLAGAEALLVDGSVPDAAAIVDGYLSLYPADGSLFLFPDELESQAFVTAVGPTRFAFAHLGIGPSITSPAYAAFETAYETRYDDAPAPGSYGASAYDAVYLAALAVEAAGTIPDSIALRAAIDAIARGGTRFGPDEFVAARAAAAAGVDIDYVGASGEVELLPPGPYEAASYETWEVQSGVVVVTGVAP